MKVQEVISKARQMINDPTKIDWTDAALLVWYNDGVVYVRSQRPDTRLDAAGAEITYVASTDIVNDDVIFAEPEKWAITVSHYIAALAFIEDEGDKRDEARSADHRAQLDIMMASL